MACNYMHYMDVNFITSPLHLGCNGCNYMKLQVHYMLGKMLMYVRVCTSMYEYVSVLSGVANTAIHDLHIFFFTFGSKIQCAVPRRCISAFINNNVYTSSGFLPPTMSYEYTMSYVQHTTSCCTSYVRCRTCNIQDIDVRHRTCDIVRNVWCRTSTYDIVCHTYDTVCCHLHI